MDRLEEILFEEQERQIERLRKEIEIRDKIIDALSLPLGARVAKYMVERKKKKKEK